MDEGKAPSRVTPPMISVPPPIERTMPWMPPPSQGDHWTSPPMTMSAVTKKVCAATFFVTNH